MGYSLNQIKNSQKGLSFSDTGKLNMRMGINDFSADDVVSKMDEQIFKVFKVFGNETYSKKIVREIVKKEKNRLLKLKI